MVIYNNDNQHIIDNKWIKGECKMEENTKEIWRAIVKLAVEQARCITDDQKALEVKSLYKQWEAQIGKVLNIGEYIQHENKQQKRYHLKKNEILEHHYRRYLPAKNFLLPP